MIGVFGGSFDPPHVGHIHIIRSFLLEYKTKLYVVPNSLSPFKKEKGVGSNQILEMLSLLKAEFALENMEIYDREIIRGGVSYTYETLFELKNQFSPAEIFLLIGEDNLENLHKWKNIELIFSLSQILVYPRPNIQRKELPMELEVFRDRIHFKESKLHPASSTEIRKGQMEYLSPQLKKYITENQLYEDH